MAAWATVCERKALGEGASDAVGLTKLRRLDRLAAHHLEETIASLEHVTRARHPVLGKLRGKDRLAAGVGRRESLPVRQLIGAALSGCGVAADRDSDRVDHLRRRQPHQAAGADHGRDAGDGRMVDAVAEIVKDVCDLAEHLIGEHGRGDEIVAAAPGDLGRGQEGRNRIARMSGAMGEADKGVVEIQVSDHDAVGENREISAGFDAAEQDCRGLL
jgi:hypothetical protein